MDEQSLLPILIHDPPRQHPAQCDSHHHALTNDNIYHYHHHHLASTHPGHSSFFHPDPPPACDPLTDATAIVAMKRRRSSLQAILVPSFLFPNAASNQPAPSPLSEPRDPALDPGTASRPGSPEHAGMPAIAKQRSRAQSAVGARSPTAPAFPSIDSNSVQVAFPADGAEGDAGPLAGPAAVLASLAPAGSKERQQHTRRRSKTLVEMLRPTRASPPPDYLLDDDPFANLTGSPMPISQPPNSYDTLRRHGSRTPSISSTTSSSSISSLGMSTSSSGTSLASSSSSTSATPPAVPLPRSPLHETPPTLPFIAPPPLPKPPTYTLGAPARSPSSPNISQTFGYPGKPQSSIPTSVPSSPFAHTGSSRATPAHQRPAIRPRPSLPSLNTLAKMNVVLSKKVRKGRVGAGLPFEPWDDLPSDDDSVPTTPATATPRAAATSGLAPQSPIPVPAPESVASPPSPSPPPPLPATQPTPVTTDPAPSFVPPEDHVPRPAQPLLPSEILSLGSAMLSDEFEVVAPPKKSAGLTTATILRPGPLSSQGSYFPPMPVPAVTATTEPRSPLPVIEESIPVSEPSLPPVIGVLEASLPTQNLVQPAPEVLPPVPTPFEPPILPPSAPSTSSSSLAVPTLPSLRPLSDLAPDLPAAAADQDSSTYPHPTDPLVQADEVFFPAPAEQPHAAVDVEPRMVFARPEEAGEYVGDGGDEMDEEDGGYVGGLLDSYHAASRAPSEEGHGQPEVVPPPVVAEVAEGSGLLRRPSEVSRLSVVHEETMRLSVLEGSLMRLVGDSSVDAEIISLAAGDYNSPLPPSSSEADGSHHPEPLLPASSSHSTLTSEYGSPPSSASASISRSASFRSYESGMSSDSGSMSGGRFRQRRHRRSDLYDDEEAIEERLKELFEDDDDDDEEGDGDRGDVRSRRSGNGRSFRSFGALHGYISAGMSNPSLSSLDLDLGGESEENSVSVESGALAYPEETLLLQRDVHVGGSASRSTASSSGRPSLSCTRSSEDDAESDMVHSPTLASFNDSSAYYAQPRIREGRYSLHHHGQSAAATATGAAASVYDAGAQMQEDQRRMLQLQLDPPLMSMSMAAVGMIHDPSQASASDTEDVATGDSEDVVHDHATKGFGFGFDQVTTEAAAVDGGDRDEGEREAVAAGDETDRAPFAVDGREDLTRDARTSMKGTIECTASNVIDTDISLAPAGEVPATTNSASVRASVASSSPFPSPTSSAFSPRPASSVVSSVISSPNSPSSPRFPQADHTMGTAITRVMGHPTSTVFFSDDDESLSYGETVHYGAAGMPGSWTGVSRAPEGGSSSYASNGTSVSRRGTSSGAYQSAYSSINGRGYGYGHRERRGVGGHGDDDEDDEERRRKRLANMGHRVEEQAVDRQSGHSRSRSIARPVTTSRSRANSRSAKASPTTPPTPALPRVSLVQPNTHFPSASASSSRYVSEEESEDEKDSEESSSDDDVPLAQRIPGALRAQNTIRRQVREEREQRKKEKALRNDARRERQETIRPAAAGAGSAANGAQSASSSHDAAVAAAAAASASAANSWASSPHARQRTLTMPSNQVLPTQGVSPHDLSRKLQSIQLASPPAHRQHHAPQQQQQHAQASDAAPLRAKSISRPSGEYPRPHDASYPQSPVSPAVRSRSIRHPAPFSPTAVASDLPPVPALRAARSFHRPSTADRTLPQAEPPLPSPPVDAEQRVSRSNTRASAREAPARRSLSTRRPSTADRPSMSSEPVPPMPASLRPSMDNARKSQRPVEPHAPSTRTSYEADQPNTLSTRQPGHMATKSNALVQQRIFVGNLQQFHMVEIGPTTTARDVVAMMDAQGVLTGWAGSGGWMVFEVAQDFGMERPIRSFELLADVQASWLKDKTVNYFILKLTPMAISLSRSAIPSSAPVHSGYVEWEAKRGKWSKRWLQLREHSLWLSKRDNGKDQIMICSLSNFDAYQVTRANKTPKPFSFAVKSTDNLSFFENTADYMHTFSCSEKDGNIWMEKILVAHSYVLQQERQVLFTGAKAATASTNNGHTPSGATVTRAGTRKIPSAPQRSAQPLVSLPPMYVTAQNNIHTDVFEPGSLLSKQL